ncbi:MAG: ACT domain-containing protein [Kangiellaceae bacterium]|nr:ACT domain-containing protein [Kangiellaceae bacterium]MCW9015335.1 ACT domain-containing protein [Kangiellaceae bacterium]
MSGIVELPQLLSDMSPQLSIERYVFATVSKENSDLISSPMTFASVREVEGITLVIEKEAADKAGLNYDRVFRKITLLVHSSLEAVGLTAAISTKLTEESISANVIAGYYHDHVFVPEEKAERAHQALLELAKA